MMNRATTGGRSRAIERPPRAAPACVNNPPLFGAGDIPRWRAEQLARSDFRVARVTSGALRSWVVTGTRISHASGGFFSLVGAEIRSDGAGAKTRYQPFIDQPEVGLLGFILRRTEDDVFVLVQAKTEPGNPGGVQLAPTFQCTRSNYLMRHGGARAPFLENFRGRTSYRGVSSTLQSEQGTRFLNKYNRNVVVEMAAGQELALSDRHAAWRWIAMRDLGALLAQPGTVNTDARSVLASTDWGTLAGRRRPFQGSAPTSAFAVLLRRSYEEQPEAAQLASTRAWLRDWRRRARTRVRLRPLDGIPGWTMSDEGIVPDAAGEVEVRYYSVRALDREVPHWTQPLMSSRSRGLVALICQEREGVLRFLVRASPEPGFGNRVQLSPTIQASSESPALPPEDRDLLSIVRQRGPGAADIVVDTVLSEEGGRFFRDENRYEIAHVEPGAVLPETAWHRWLGLAELRRWISVSGALNNEMRSALSLLLAYL